ncbi:rhodanese-related sulfurtransferase [Pseudobdellovibrio sp. HCB154]|uniref:oxygen-dependent tRNA uridine(34) hydroxylase TrhO n=1 Tax=Pseudobdellovibrio sp. HCB154 TaxID=3386277 RepID=UPI003916EA0D
MSINAANGAQSANQYFITTFYKFLPIADVEGTKTWFNSLAEKHQIKGLIILAAEGFNSTVSAKSKENLENFKKDLLANFGLTELNFKDSLSDKSPFRRFVVKIRPEIVTLGTPDLVPPEGINRHLTPTQWNEVMKNEKPIIIDTRNWYEYKIGTFKGALNPKTEKFTEFPAYMDSQNISKDQKVLIFCTGGIRCEKGILELTEKGYSNVYQLDGGILNYLKEYPNDQYEGECFVFDHRVAVDQDLKPTVKYTLCPHCGQPGNTPIDCKRCDTHDHICEDCAKIEWKKDTCSKDCAYHYKLHPDRKAPRQVQPYETEEN